MAEVPGTYRDNAEDRRFEYEVEGGTAVALYNLVQGGVMITETLVPPELEGRGLAGTLARHVLADIKTRGLVILPVCPFFAAYLQKHPEWREIVHPAYRASLGLG